MKRYVSFDKLTGLALAFLAAGLLVTGCASNQPGSQSLKNLQPRIDAQDLSLVTESAVNSLLDSGILDRTTHHPAVLGIGRYVNNTAQCFDSDVLTHRISIALLNAGKVVVAQSKQNKGDITFEPSPDFILSGKVTQMIQSTGSKGKSTFVFQFSIADSNNLTVWLEEKEITKIAQRGSGIGCWQ